jgi:hypothetical protein
MKRIFAILPVLFAISAAAQENAIMSLGNDSLMKHTDAVIRNYESVFIQNDLNNATHKISKTVTVLNEQGKYHGIVAIPLDKFTELKSFSGMVTDIAGKTIKKMARKDLTVNAYSPYLASDDKYAYYEYRPAGYPYTVHYEYELKIKNGISYYPGFYPVASYRTSLEKAKYTLQTPSSTEIRFKTEKMSQEQPLVTETATSKTYEWVFSDIPAIQREPYAPELISLIPVLRVAPNDFCMEGQCGNMSDWNNLGKWITELMAGRDELSPRLKEKLISMTADASSEKEKVKILFEYLQSTTRYVAILLGIGGFQPMSASDVEKTGFGDCKALTNYLKCMLTAVGIPSVYTVISTDRKDLYPDFASLGQMNHVILAVPMPADTLWLECTNQLLPFNYPHTNIAGHQCLLVTDEGGKICRVKEDTASNDNMQRTILLEIDAAGNAKGAVSSLHRKKSYEKILLSFVHNMSREEQINELAKSLRAPKATVTDLHILQNNTENPDIRIDYKVLLEKFANKSGNRLFLPFSVLRPSFAAINPGKRTQDIVVNGMMQTEVLHVTIPDGYTPESIPKSVSINSRFGDYFIHTGCEGNVLHIEQKIHLKSGHYPANSIEEFRNFFKDIEKECGKRAVFKQ